MANSAFSLLKELKKNATAMSGGSFMPPQPLPNSIKAKQIEQQQLEAQQAEAGAGAGNEQLMQMQKAQEDAVKQLQQTQQQLAQAQSDMQNMQMQSQQQVQQVQMDAQQQINKAQMDAQYELQAEKIKNQQKLLSMQEKYTKSLNKESPNQSPILANQLKRVVKKVNRLKMASTNPPEDPLNQPNPEIIPQQNRGIMESEKKYQGMPHANILPSQRTQQQWNEQADWKRQHHEAGKQNLLSDPRNQQFANNYYAAPATSNSSYGFLDAVKDFYDPDSPNNAHAQLENVQNNTFGEYGTSLGGFAPRLYSDMYLGFVPNFATGIGGMAKGIYNLSPSQFGKGLLNFGLGAGEGIVTYGTGGMINPRLLGVGSKIVSKVAPRLAGVPGKAGKIEKFVGKKWSDIPGLSHAYNWARNTPIAKWVSNNPVVKYPTKLVGGLIPAPAYAGYQALEATLGGNEEETTDQQQEGQSPSGTQPYSDAQMNNDASQLINLLPQLINSFAPGQQQAQPWDKGMNFDQRENAIFDNFERQQNYYDNLAKRMNKSGADASNKALYSPIPTLQHTGYHRPQLFKSNLEDFSRRQSYGAVGDFIKDIIFNLAIPYFTGSNPLSPDMASIHKNLVNSAPYDIPAGRYE